MRCTDCGREINNGSKFCPYCGVPVKKKNEKLLLIVLVVAIFAIAAGAVCVIVSSVFGRIKEGGAVSQEAKSGINMVAVNGQIFNSSGAVNDKFKGTDYYEFYTDPEGAVGMIFADGGVYMIDSALKETLIDDGCVDAVMNYTGEYVYIATSEKSKLGKGLCVYSTKDNSYNLIEACDITYLSCITASPDGNTVLVSRGDGIFIMGLDGTSEKIYDEQHSVSNVFAVSNDRKVAYFSPDPGEGLFCWKEGNVINLYNEYFGGYIALNSDCKKIMFENTDGLRYFDSNAMNESKVILSYPYFDAIFKGKEFFYSDVDANYFPGADSFEGMYIKADRSSYWLNADMEAVCKSDSLAYAYSDREFKVYDIEDDSIKAILYKDGETQTEELYHNDNGVYDVAVSDNGEVLWILLDDKIVTYKDGKVMSEAFKVPGDGFSIGNIMNDPLSDKAYCLSDNGTVFALDENGNHSEIGTVKNAYGLWRDYSNGKSIIAVEDDDGDMTYIVHDHLVKKDR
ncbi:zinc ribbon domain-containing protein [Butyrivibrio sp. M55]|uniref:zinc ribbon domain-containing protein n=1 Tax=Butyrivibrio sp. M55 TaxID=1855323 RepID=UPI0008F01DF6|nr:zinc ribbon domain-containing protein [Butyrivibrio sp. M55]SFU32058.1 zinc-ribbon domain-containing protein [Butyrivibrio sp. M55]